MTNRTGIIVVAVVLTVAILVAVFFWRVNRSLNRATGPAAATTDHSYMPAPAAQAVPPLPPPSGNQLPGGAYDPTDPRWAWWNEQRQIDRSFEWKMPISFYGVVLDESGNPVEGAQMRFQWNDASAAGTSYAETLSDARGRFSLGGVNGKVLEVNVAKKGYRALENRTDLEYAAFFEKNYHRPDPDDPVVFRIRKIGAPELLITRQTLYGVKPDGTAHYIDLTTGAKKAGEPAAGDIAVRITQAVAATQPFDWSLVLEGVGSAGLVEAEDKAMFEAPEGGYQTTLRYDMNAADPRWRSQLQKTFFVKSGDGKLHARITADVMAKYNEQSAIDLRVLVNPSGSRNLEPPVTTNSSAP